MGREFQIGHLHTNVVDVALRKQNAKVISLKYFTQGDTELFQKGHIFCVKPDNRGNLWIGTSQGLFCYNGQTKQIKNFTSTNSQLPEGNVYEVSFVKTSPLRGKSRLSSSISPARVSASPRTSAKTSSPMSRIFYYST